jgi:excisionase family DNA binding protein
VSVSEAPTQQTIVERLRSFDGALSVAELAQVLNVKRLTVERWCKVGRIPHFRIGRTIRFCGSVVARWLLARQSMPAWFENEACRA